MKERRTQGQRGNPTLHLLCRDFHRERIDSISTFLHVQICTTSTVSLLYLLLLSILLSTYRRRINYVLTRVIDFLKISKF